MNNTGTTDVLNAIQIEELAKVIRSEMGDGYTTTTYLRETPECYYVALWTKRESRYGSDRDELVKTFNTTREWYLFFQAAHVLVKNREVSEFEGWIGDLPDRLEVSDTETIRAENGQAAIHSDFII